MTGLRDRLMIKNWGIKKQTYRGTQRNQKSDRKTDTYNANIQRSNYFPALEIVYQ